MFTEAHPKSVLIIGRQRSGDIPPGRGRFLLELPANPTPKVDAAPHPDNLMTVKMQTSDLGGHDEPRRCTAGQVVQWLRRAARPNRSIDSSDDRRAMEISRQRRRDQSRLPEKIETTPRANPHVVFAIVKNVEYVVAGQS